jgi:hypothetical protein
MAELEHTASDIALALEGAEANRNWDAAEYRKAEDAINGWSGSTTKKDVHIQFCSYELVLLPYGSYYISDTTGG